MGWHTCRYPCWHRALILLGTLVVLYGWGILAPWGTPAVLVGLLVSTWLLKHLLQWRCQGHAPSEGRTAAGLLLLLGSAAYMTHDHHHD